MKQGRLDDAMQDFQSVLDKEPSNADAKQHVEEVLPLKSSIQKARDLFEAENYPEAVETLGGIIDVSSYPVIGLI